MAARGCSALVLEENELGRWALRRALEAVGFDVVAVPNWAEASECLLREHIHVALVATSSVSEQVAEVVGAMSRVHPEINLILLADEDSISELRRVLGPGVDILPKPLDLDRVARLARLRSAVVGHSQHA